MFFDEFEENRLTVIFNDSVNMKVATYDESLDIENSKARIGFQLRLGPDQDLINIIYNSFSDMNINSIKIKSGDNMIIREINHNMKFVTVSVGFFIDEIGIEKTKGILALEYSILNESEENLTE